MHSERRIEPGPNRTVRWAAVAALLIALAATLAPSTEAQNPKEAALLERVNQFFSVLQAGRFNVAEEFVTEDTRLYFRQIPKEPFLGYENESVKISTDGKTAVVITRVDVFVGVPPTKFNMARTTRWRFEDASWYVEIPKPDPNATLLGPFAASMPKAEPKAPEELKFKGYRYRYGKVAQGQVKTAVFPFTNPTDHAVTITDVITNCECLKPKLAKKEWQPGESGELAIEFNPTAAGIERDYAQTIVVKTEPGNSKILLNVLAIVAPVSRSYGSDPE